MAATTPERKLSEFELKMAQRRAATEASILSSPGSTASSSASPSPTSKVSQLAERFSKGATPNSATASKPSPLNTSTLSKASSTSAAPSAASPSGRVVGATATVSKPASVNTSAMSKASSVTSPNGSVVAAKASPLNTSTTSTSGARVAAVNKLSTPNGSVLGATATVSRPSPVNTSTVSKAAAPSPSGTVVAAKSTPTNAAKTTVTTQVNKTPPAQTSLLTKPVSGDNKAAALLNRMASRNSETPPQSPNNSLNDTTVHSVGSDDAMSFTYKTPLSPNGTQELEQKLSARRTVVDEMGTVTTSDVVVAALGDSIMSTSSSPMALSPIKAPSSDGVELTEKLTARRTVVDIKGKVTTSDEVPQPEVPQQSVVATKKISAYSKPISIPPNVKPHSSFDSPRALSRIETDDGDSTIYYSAGDVSTDKLLEEKAELESGRALPPSALSPRSRFGANKPDHQKAVTFGAEADGAEAKARRRKQLAKHRELAIDMPYVPNYIPDEPLSTARSENRVWTLVFAYCIPLTIMAVISILQATADERLFSQLPTLAILEAFPPTRTMPTEWAPTGIRKTSGIERPTSPVLKATRVARASDNRDGYIWTAVGPRFDPSWSAESQSLIQGSSVVLDDWGNLFFSPTYTADPDDADASLIALDAQTGERKWVWRNPIVTSFFSSTPAEAPVIRAGSGTPLVLNDPDANLEQRRVPQIVYHATRTKAHALRSSDGSNVWSMPTGVPESEDFDSNRVWGLTYVGVHDALVGLTNDGWIFLLDRATGTSMAEVKKLPCAPPSGTTSAPRGWDAFKLVFSAEEVATGSIGLRCVMSQFATAPGGNGSRLFVTATAKDDQDGYEDGFADRAAIYAVEIVEGEADSKFPLRIRVAQSVPYGSKISDLGAPAVSVKGEWVALGDASIYGIRMLYTSNLSVMHEIGGLSYDGGVPSVALAEDEGAGSIYVKMDTAVIKVELPLETSEDEGPLLPQVVWTQTFTDLPNVAYGLEVRPGSAPVIVGNGIALALHVATSAYPYASLRGLPLASGVMFLDRATGAVRSYTVSPSGGEAIADISVGMDGSIFLVHDPMLRASSVDAYARFSVDLHSLAGGISRFKPLNFLELARDASCAALKRIDNTLQYQGGWLSSPPPGGEDAGKEDAKHVSALAWQAVVGFQIFANTGAAKNLPNLGVLQSNLDSLASAVNNGAPLPIGLDPSTAFSLLKSVRPFSEVMCQELSAL